MINNAVLMGRLTAEPELKSTNSGTAVLSFTVAVDRNYTPKGKEKQADFINCVAWKQTAEFIARYFRKGQMIGLVGEIQTRTYEDRDGKKRYATEVVVHNASFCGSKSENNQTPTNQNNSPYEQNSQNAGFYPSTDQYLSYDDELPF